MENSELEIKQSILVVDDCATNRLLLSAILKSNGYDVQECSNGQECLDFCATNLPAMILLDVMMPEVSGIHACEKLRARYSKDELPIIIVSTLSESQDVTQGLKVGANDYLLKPVDRQVLLARLENHLAASRAQKEINRQKKELERLLGIQNGIGNALPDALLVHDISGHLVYCNQQLFQVCGTNSLKAIEQVFSTLHGGCFEKDLLGMFEQIRCAQGNGIEQELECKGSNCRFVRVFSKQLPVTGEGNLRLWLWRDETAIKELENRVSQQIKLDTVGLFAAGIAHNFNNILGSMLGATELLDRITKGEEKAGRCLSVLKRGVQSGMRLTRKMSAITKRSIAIEQAGSDLARVLESVVGGYRELLESRISFEILLPPDLPNVSLNDIHTLEIFGSALSNAVESISGKGQVRVSGNLNTIKNCIELQISDTGSGMPAEVQARLYEPFFSTKKLDQMSGISVEGRGLGLWNAYNLIKSSGGNISIRSSVGQGTTVYIALPIVVKCQDSSISPD